MRGVVFLGDRTLELREFPDPTPGPGEVVLAIKASGMCGSDLNHYRAAAHASAGRRSAGPVIAGHEPCGVVAAVGPTVKAFKIGSAYDTVNVGLAVEQTQFNATLTTTDCSDLNSGNSRCGHEFGTKLPEADKKALLEYLKTL